MILILGAGGFLGFSFASHLSNVGLHFRTLSRTFQWDELPGEHRFRCDVFSCDHATTLLDQVTTIVYMAGSTDLARAEADSASDLAEHVFQMDSFFAFMRSVGKCDFRFLFVSSSGTVYGDSSGSSSVESDRLSPKSAYGRRNVFLEELFSTSVRLLGAQSLILRVSNPFGPSQYRFRRKGLVQSLIHSSLTQQPMQLRGMGKQVRDYIYVDDLVSVILKLTSFDRWPFGILNVASGYSFSANEIVEILRGAGFSPVVNLSSESSAFDVDCSQVDNSRLCSALNIDHQLLYPFTDSKLSSLSLGLNSLDSSDLES